MKMSSLVSCSFQAMKEVRERLTILTRPYWSVCTPRIFFYIKNPLIQFVKLQTLCLFSRRTAFFVVVKTSLLVFKDMRTETGLIEISKTVVFTVTSQFL